MRTNTYIRLTARWPKTLGRKAKVLEWLGWKNQSEICWSDVLGKWTQGVWR